MFGITETYAAFCLIVFIVGSAAGMLVGGLLGPKAHHRPHMGGHHAAAGTYHTHR